MCGFGSRCCIAPRDAWWHGIGCQQYVPIYSIFFLFLKNDRQYQNNISWWATYYLITSTGSAIWFARWFLPKLFVIGVDAQIQFKAILISVTSWPTTYYILPSKNCFSLFFLEKAQNSNNRYKALLTTNHYSSNSSNSIAICIWTVAALRLDHKWRLINFVLEGGHHQLAISCRLAATPIF